MKKIFITILSVLMLLTLASCRGSKADVDLTKKDAYTAIVDMINQPKNYVGKTVEVTAESSVLYNFTANRIDMQIIMGSNKSSESAAYYEIRSKDGKYPTVGCEATFFGKVTEEKYLAVYSFKSEDISVPEYEIDALDMSAEELNEFIKAYNSAYNKSEYYGKKIRIYGNCESSHDTLKWLLGLDKNGSVTWDVELYDPTGKIVYPTAKSGTANPVEVIGTLSTYEEDGIIYACIKVERVVKVQSVFE